QAQRSLRIAGPHPSRGTVGEISPARHVTAKTPPTFIFHTSADELVSARNATLFYDALRKAGVPAELHIFAEGRHGLGLAMTESAWSVWPSLLENWLRGLHIIGVADSASRTPGK